jgi:hypothetical protein
MLNLNVLVHQKQVVEVMFLTLDEMLFMLTSTFALRTLQYTTRLLRDLIHGTMLTKSTVRESFLIIVDYSGGAFPPSPAPVLHITSVALANEYGRPDTATRAQVTYNGVNELGDITDATIVFNTNATASQDKNSPTRNDPYYNPNLTESYGTVFKKKTMHEVGHTLGLCDVEYFYQSNGASVMNGSPDDCPNDNCNTQPFDVQDCDNNAISRSPRFAPPPPPPTATPTPSTGGGGGGTGGGGYRCYDVYEEDISYVCVDGHGCSQTVFYEYQYTYCSY